MAVDLGNAFHFLIPLGLCLAGFHGVLFYPAPWKKTASWCAFQLGLVVFLLQLASKTNPFPAAIALSILAVTLGTAVLFVAFGVKAGPRAPMPKIGKTPRRVSK